MKSKHPVWELRNSPRLAQPHLHSFFLILVSHSWASEWPSAFCLLHLHPLFTWMYPQSWFLFSFQVLVPKPRPWDPLGADPVPVSSSQTTVQVLPLQVYLSFHFNCFQNNYSFNMFRAWKNANKRIIGIHICPTVSLCFPVSSLLSPLWSSLSF